MTQTTTRPVPGIRDTNAEFAAIIAADAERAAADYRARVAAHAAADAAWADRFRPWYAILLPLTGVLAAALIVVGIVAIATLDEPTRQAAFFIGCLAFSAGALTLLVVTVDLYGRTEK